MFRVLLAAACGLALTLAATRSFGDIFSGDEFTVADTNCSDLKLKAASGVPYQAVHKYKLVGTCYYRGAAAFMTLGAVWDAKTNTFKEQAKLEGGTTGSAETILKCSSDPYLSTIGCALIAHKNTTQWNPLSNKPIKGRPIGQGHVNAAFAAKLSQTSIANSVKAASHALGGMEFGVDRLGGDYRGFKLAQPQPGQCRQTCMGEVPCRSWTYVKPGIKGPQAMCFLKKTVPPKRTDSCCVSGVK